MSLIHLSISVTAINLALLTGCATTAETRADDRVTQESDGGWSTAAPAGISQDTALGEDSQELLSRDTRAECVRHCNEAPCDCGDMIGAARGACFRRCQADRRACIQHCSS